MIIFPDEPYLYLGRNGTNYHMVNVLSQRRMSIPGDGYIKVGIGPDDGIAVRLRDVHQSLRKHTGMYVVFSSHEDGANVSIVEPADYAECAKYTLPRGIS